MKVMKFGGTSVGSVNSILSVKKIVESAGEPVIVVVSALGGITDQLISTSRMAAMGDAAYEGAYREIVRRHEEMVQGVIPAGETQTLLHYQVNELLDELKDIFQGIYLIKDLSPKTSDTIVSYGERLSSLIASRLIQGAVWFDSRTFIKTEKKHNKHTLDTELTNRLVREAFKEIPRVSLVPGFISSDKVSGDVTNLGRGGSDYTAAVIARAKFHAVAEKNGTIIPIGNWVLEQSIRTFSEWRNRYGVPFVLSVNISALQYQKEDFVETLLNIIHKYDVDPDEIELEITESILIDDFSAVTEKMQLLKEYGIRISLDDFGTGFSSLSYLKKLPINTLKIDKSFTDTLFVLVYLFKYRRFSPKFIQ